MEKRKIVIVMLFVLSAIFIGTGLTMNFIESVKENSFDTQAMEYKTSNTEDALYLSDISYIANQSYAGWDRIRYDEIERNGKISVRIENNVFTFTKGIWAHATSQVTYDISSYDYKYFTAFVGMNTTAGGNGVTYAIYTSADGKDWGEAKYKEVKKPRDNATAVKIDLEGANYLRLCATAIGGNGNAHSVYADAKLVNDVEEESNFMTVSDYDKIIKEKFPNQNEISPELEVLLLKRELMKRIGTYTLNSIYNQSQENKDTLDWILNNPSVLRHFILGGTPENSSYLNAFNQLSRIYNANKADFSNKTITKYGTELADLYTRMAIAMALTHDGNPFGLWIDSSPENLSDALNRYQIYKEMHKNDNFVVLRNEDGSPKMSANGTPQLDITEWFEKYNVEEMRYIFNNQSDDEEVLWLNEYTQSFIDKYPNEYGKYLSPHPYMDYRNENLNQPEFYDPALKDAWDEDFHGIFSKYNISYRPATSDRSSLKKIWMFLRNKQGVLTGAVCGGISKIGSTTRVVHGIPAVVIGQPGHAAILYYWQDTNGRGYWNIDNDVSGWTASERGERLPLGWGNASSNYARGSHQVVYLALAQEALNDYDNLVKSEELIMLGDSSSNKTEKEKMYRKALEVQSINFDAWLNLVNLYLNDDTKTEEDYYNLAQDIGENLKYFPLPMYQLTNLIKPKLTSVENSYKFTLLQTRILKEASLTPENTATNYYVQQPNLTRLEANFLLGKLDSSIATFSFDGDDAGKIVLSDRFNGNGVRWDYAIKGKGANGVWDVSDFKEVSFSAEEEHKLQLTKEEIETITAENDIYVHIVGVGYEEENLYKIDINESRGLPETLFASDLENKVLGVVDTIEWKYKENDNWTTYKNNQPDLTGDKTIILRMGATGTYLPSKTSQTFTFTKDVVNNKRKYIPVEQLSLHAVSTEAVNNGGSARYALDANYNTRWHSAWDGSDTKRFITVKLDKPVHLSAVEFVPAGGGNGKIYDGTIWGSMDGENWTILSQQKNLTYTNSADTLEQAISNIKSFDIDDPTRVQYVKIVADRTNGNWFTARAFNFYEDKTKTPTITPTAEVEYSTTALTNKNVIATLVKPSTNITITNNGGKNSYTFTENGKFTFEFVDEDGNKGKTVAVVNNIDKTAPIAKVSYDIIQPTNKNVKVTLTDYSEDLTITNNVGRNTYIFTENGEFTFEFVDKAGNKGSTTATVNWIDKVAPTAKIEYSTTAPTNKDVIARLTDFSEDITITNNSGKNTYTFTKNGVFTFEFVDKAGNKGTAKAIVNNINRVVPTAKVEYSTINPTNKNVVAKLTGLTEGVVITNNGGKDTYTFTENGTFTFEFRDRAGNEGSVVAIVNNIDKVAPTAKVIYSPSSLTNSVVVATLTDYSEEIKVLNNDGKNSYTFNENGKFEFKISDKAGNIALIKAQVTWIDKSVTEKPNTPSNKPAATSKPVIIIPSNSNNNGVNNINNQVTIANNLKSFTAGKIELIVPVNTWLENTELKVKYLELNSNIQEKIGGENEYFEIFVEPQQNIKTSMKMIINLDSEKVLAGIYKISNNKEIEKLEYLYLGDNQIELDIDSLGEYIISYENEKNNFDNDVVKPEKAKENKQDVNTIDNNLTIIFLGLLVVIFGFVILGLKWKRKY